MIPTEVNFALTGAKTLSKRGNAIRAKTIFIDSVLYLEVPYSITRQNPQTVYLLLYFIYIFHKNGFYYYDFDTDGSTSVVHPGLVQVIKANLIKPLLKPFNMRNMA